MQRLPARLASLFLASSLGLAACGAPSSLPVKEDPGTGKSDAADAATLRFAASGAPSVSGTLTAGRGATLIYDLDRIVGCRSDAWAVTGYVLAKGASEPLTVALSRLESGSTDDGEAEVVAVDGHFIVPNVDEVAIWFSVNDKYGCIAYDSNDSANYAFAVTRRPEATIHFDADWSEIVEGRLQPNGVVHLDYDLARLSQCPTSTPYARYRVDGGSVRTAQLVAAADDRAAADVTLPAMAKALDLWFERTSRYGCNETDSDFGANYHFTIE